MHSCKNDFIFTKTRKLKKKNISFFSNRYTGIGFDQVFNILYVNNRNVFFNIYNSDGSFAESCGNGFKCLGKYVKYRYGINSFIAVSNRRFFSKIILKNKKVIVKINFFSFIFKKIGFIFNKRKMFLILCNRNFFIRYLPEIIDFCVLSIGNPHTLVFTKKKIKYVNNVISNFFFNGVNVSIYYGYLKTYERGSGITRCCGTATTSFGMLYILKCSNYFKTNKMAIYWKCKNTFSKKYVFLIGKSKFVFKGIINENI